MAISDDGTSSFDYLAKHPDDAAVFNVAMSSFAQFNSGILAAYDFSRFERVVDVGGGQGALLNEILSANPKLHGILADLPAVVAGATALQTGAIAERCEIVGIDFFKEVPEGADAYVMKGVVHPEAQWVCGYRKVYFRARSESRLVWCTAWASGADRISPPLRAVIRLYVCKTRMANNNRPFRLFPSRFVTNLRTDHHSSRLS